jgi:hypothetical protein
MSPDVPVLRFGGSSSGVDSSVGESVDASGMFQAFATWLGAIYAAEHHVPLDPNGLAAFDPADVMPLFHTEAERAQGPMEAGLTIEEAWLAHQLLLRRPSTCVLVDRFVGQPVDRITRLRVTAADVLVAELIDRLARNFRFPGRTPRVAAFEDAYFEATPPISVGVVVDGLAHVVSFVSADPRSSQLTYHDPWPESTLLPGAQAPEDGLLTIEGDDLAGIAAYALVADEATVERSPDIYASTVRHEADPSKGAPLDVAWHGTWQLSGPSFCLIVEGSDLSDVERIPYRAVLPLDEIIRYLREAWLRRQPFACPASVRVSANRGHSVTLLDVGSDVAVFHDPWPSGSLLAADANELGINAQAVDNGWQITVDELGRCLHAVFLSPEVLAEIQGHEFRQSLANALTNLSFFNIHEVGREMRDDIWEVEAEPGGFRDEMRIAFAVDGADRLEAALLSLTRPWLDGQDRPFAVDILKSFFLAVVSPLDAGEATVAIKAVEAIPYGQQAVTAALGSGAPHLLGQARNFVLALLGAQESALVTLAFTRIVAVNAGGDTAWIHIGAERAGRTAGPLLVGPVLPSPWEGVVAGHDDNETHE